MVRTFRHFLDFCYGARRNIIDENCLEEMANSLKVFHEERNIFISEGVRDSISLPRQHSMVHYIDNIRKFGAPNGLCTSITESKHIEAVKKPWRRSNRMDALAQMLIANQRLDKLAAARVDFNNRGMLKGTCLSSALDYRLEQEEETPGKPSLSYAKGLS